MTGHETHSGRPFRRRGTWRALGASLLLLAGVVGVWIARSPSTPTGPSAARPDSPPPAGPPWFRDVTAASGVDFTYRNGEEAGQFTILESLGGGVALLD